MPDWLQFVLTEALPLNLLCLVFALLLALASLGLALRHLARTVLILVRGWPPPHVDGDGDPVRECVCDAIDEDDG